MTREEKIDKILDELTDDFIKVKLPLMETMTLFAKVQNAVNYVATLSAEPCEEWIPVGERLPEKGKQVLCCNKRGSVFTSAVTHIEEYKYGYRYAHFGKHCGVVAWMPLPKPYVPDINDGKMSEIPTDSEPQERSDKE